MANDCLPQVGACRLRVARLGTNGVPVQGANNMYVSSALLSVAASWDIADATAITGTDGCGAEYINYTSPASLRKVNLTINLVTPDPQLSELLSAGDVLTSGAAVGYSAPPLTALAESPVSIEVWARRIRAGKQDPTFPYAWWVFPWVQNLRPDDFTLENAPINPTFVGEAYENEGWYNGPTNDWPLPNASNRVFQWIPTAAIPTAACGYSTIAAS